MKDYYGVLGVPRNASEAEIKKAYRKLARELHPDVAGPEGEERFKEVAAAYDVLGNADKRAQYDRGVDPRSASGASGGAQGFGFEDIFETFFGGGQQRRGPASRVQRGGDTLVHEEVTLEEAVGLIAERIAKGGGKKPAKKAKPKAEKAPAKKPTAKSLGVTKVVAKKKAPAKKASKA